MSLLKLLLGEKKKSALVAKERLQLIIARERPGNLGITPDYLPALQSELIYVISKYTNADSNDIKLNLEKQGNFEVLEIKIEIPNA